MKILVISPVYALSGVPLAQLRLAKSLSRIGHEVSLIYGCKRYSKIEKVKKLKIIFLINLEFRNVFPLIKYLLKNKPDIIFSAEDHLNISCISFNNYIHKVKN